MAQGRKKFKQDIDRSHLKVDVLIQDVPYDNYIQIREELIQKGYKVQGYQSGYWEDLSKPEIPHDDKV
jgi:hypothetical protein